MLILPIRQQDSTVRRFPWVSAGLIGLNVFFFLVLSLGAGTAQDDARKHAVALLEYLAARPYLAVSSPVAQRFGRGFVDDLDEARAEWVAAKAVPPPELVRREQDTLDRMARQMMAALDRLPSRRFGFIPATPRADRVLSSMFIHAGLFHLLGNMLFLFLSGPFVEDVFGRALFSILYLLSGVAAAVAHAGGTAIPASPLIGASGAIAGVMGAFLVRLTFSRIEFLVFPFILIPTIRFHMTLPAFVVVPLWGLEQVWYARAAPEAGVAWWAHIGGLVFGILAALVIRLTRVEERWIHPAIEREISIVQDPSLERALDARLVGNLELARREIKTALLADPESPDAWRESLEIALLASDDREVGRNAIRLLDVLQRARLEELALDLAADERLRERTLPPRFWLSAATLLERQGDARQALELYERAVDSAPGDPGALRALIRRGEILARGGNVRDADAAYRRAKAHPACQEPWVSVVDRALAELAGRAPRPRTDDKFEMER